MGIDYFIESPYLKPFRKQEKPLKSKISLVLITIPYIILYKILCKILFQNLLARKPLKSTRSLILVIIPCIILHKTLIKNLLEYKKTVKTKEIPNYYYDEGYLG